jgi:hypothetical protein
VAIHQAHLQIRQWLRQLAGVLSTEVASVGGADAVIVHHTPALSAGSRAEILDRFVGFPVYFTLHAVSGTAGAQAPP